MSAFFPIQQAIYNELTSDTTLMNMVKGVHDAVPVNKNYPYITLGEATSLPYRTFSRFGEEVTVTLHIWSQYKGYKEATTILDRMNTLLADKDLSVNGYDAIGCYYDFSDAFIDSDGITRHIPVRYRIIVQKQQ